MESILRAIAGGYPVQVRYWPGERIVEPIAFHTTTKGNPALLAYQIAGASASGVTEGYKRFLLSKLSTPGRSAPLSRPDEAEDVDEDEALDIATEQM